MTDEELDALLDELEAGFREDVQAQLTLVAEEFADAVGTSTELVAAAFSVSRIRTMWNRRVPGLMRTLRRFAGRAATAAAEDIGEETPPTDVIDAELAPYTEATTQLLRAVGDRLSAEATQTLADGTAAGESLDELKARLIAVFSNTGSQLGPTRAERIAMTETTRAWNAGTLAGAQALTGPERPLVKQWVTRRDENVRVAHSDADGQLQLLDDAFDVGGTPMQYPGDPSAPADLTINCRCVLRTATAPERTASMADDGLTAADAEVHTGAMIALMPRREDAERLAVESGEDVGELHLTLAFLGNAVDWNEYDRQSVLSAVQVAAGVLMPVAGRAFGVALWNPHSDSPVLVYNIGDDLDRDGSTLGEVHHEVLYQLEDGWHDADMPRQHSPWVPHIAATYSAGPSEDLVPRLGDVTFDRIRVAFGGEHTDFPLLDEPSSGYDEPSETEGVPMEDVPTTAAWTTPGRTALAFENQQTGDGRVFTPGALYWSGAGPWPLQYADEMQGGHDGAQLAGAITGMDRDGDRIPGTGVLYLTQQSGYEAALLLSQGAPLGVSVDLDDVDIEVVDATPGAVEAYKTRLINASVLPTEDGGWLITGKTPAKLTASGVSLALSSQNVSFTVARDGTVPDKVAHLVAAAGDPDSSVGVVVDEQKSGDYLMRITRGRIRGATLVSIPAYADARIVLEDPDLFASYSDDEVTAAIKSTTDYDRVLRHVRKSKAPSGAARVAQMLRMPVVAAQRLLAVAASRGEIVRLTRGLYTDSTTSAKADHLMNDNLVASVTGSVSLPVADRDTGWDGAAAKSRVFEWADGDVDRIGDAFAYRDDEADPLTKGAYKLGFADLIDGVLTIVPNGVFAALGAMSGARGGVDLPDDERAAVQARLDEVATHVNEVIGEVEMDNMQASAWAAMRDLPPMPADWFREPTVEELPPGGPGVNYANGRIFGWVAQAGEPHAGFAKKITIEGLGRIDTQHFLRQRFQLDDGATVKAGAFTMNAGHHRDGAECETSACQFDDTRTVAGIVTVGMSERGMWFSGAAAPWLSEWDRSVFMSTQPSYHLKKGPNGNWQLRAVLAVPVPGHSSPLMASAVVGRAQMALTAAATMAEVEDAVAAEEAVQAAAQPVVEVVEGIDYDRLADSMVAAMARAEDRKAAEAAELAELLAEAAKLGLDNTGTEGV